MTGALLLAAVWALAVLVTDVRTRRIPGPLAAAGAVPALAVAAASGRWWPAALGALALAAVYLAARLVSPAGLGGGDLRLAPACGALAGVPGPDSWALAAAGAFLLTAALAVAAAGLARARGASRPAGVPHGPSMVLASLAVLAAAAH